jgi:hypothetical protein
MQKNSGIQSLDGATKQTFHGALIQYYPGTDSISLRTSRFLRDSGRVASIKMVAVCMDSAQTASRSLPFRNRTAQMN